MKRSTSGYSQAFFGALCWGICGLLPAATPVLAAESGATEQAAAQKQAGDSKTPGANTSDSEKPPAAESKAPASEPQLKFRFRFAPWKDVLEWFAQQAELTLDLNEVPPGTFNFVDNSRTYTPTEALDVVNGYLLQKGHVLVRRDKFLVVANVDNIPPNLIPQV